MTTNCHNALKARHENIQKLKQPFFWSRVQVGKLEECWNWTRRKRQNGYGEFKFEKKPILTHRFAYQCVFGKIPKGMFVCHHCDNKLCCNPLHLFLGSHQDNMDDAVKKGRMARLSGERNGMYGRRGNLAAASKITDEQAIELRQLYSTGAFTQDQLAKRFGLKQVTISTIVTGKVRKHLPMFGLPHGQSR